jgi:hypothetical protein
MVEAAIGRKWNAGHLLYRIHQRLRTKHMPVRVRFVPLVMEGDALSIFHYDILSSDRIRLVVAPVKNSGYGNAIVRPYQEAL